MNRPIDITEVIETYYDKGFNYGFAWGALFGATLIILIL